MIYFDVYGPLLVPVTKLPGGKIIDTDRIKENWTENRDWAQIAMSCGCYLFARRAGKGYTPLYVGKTTKSFKKECFQDHKIKKLQNALVKTKSGNLVVFFIVHPVKQGPKNAKAIDKIETFLIEIGSNRNPDIENDSKVPNPSWAIQGLIRGSQGAWTNSSHELERALRL